MDGTGSFRYGSILIPYRTQFRLKPLLPQRDEGTDNFQYERFLHAKGFTHVAGCDEVGRGPLAGPVVAACVILPPECPHTIFKDSKTLSHSQRQALFQKLKDINGRMGVGIVSCTTIDTINILQASLLAMKRAVDDLSTQTKPDFLLVDGKFEIPSPLPQETLIKGETKSGSIAAASIVAKVTRDRLMTDYHAKFPQYNFKNNKGYPTKEHKQAVAKYGPCPEHRLTFKGVREFV